MEAILITFLCSSSERSQFQSPHLSDLSAPLQNSIPLAIRGNLLPFPGCRLFKKSRAHPRESGKTEQQRTATQLFPLSSRRTTMGSSSSSASASIGSLIVVVAVMFFFLLAAFVVFLYVYARYRRAGGGRVHLDFASGTTAAAPVTGHGLGQELIRSLPVVVFKKEGLKETVDCSVCLSEIVDGDKARLLPKCNHGFHIDCIDMWFRSHSTCPLCRSPVEAIPDVGYPPEQGTFPTNVLFWGSQRRVSSTTVAGGGGRKETSGENPSSSSSSSSSATKIAGALAIDIPNVMPEDEMKTPAETPTSTRLRSMKRLWSREKKVAIASPCGSCRGDYERRTAED